MKRHILFLQGGGGQEDYDADALIVAALRSHLNSTYEIHYPLLLNEEAPDFGRMKQIAHEISLREAGLILVAHSLGASMLLRYFSEHKNNKSISGIFLLATPFWSGEEDWKQALKLQSDFAGKLNKDVPLFFYHCQDDQEVPFEQFKRYKECLPWATFRTLSSGGHQFDKGLSMIANDIKSIHYISNG